MKKIFILLTLSLFLTGFTSCADKKQLNESNSSPKVSVGTQAILYNEEEIINHFLAPMHQGMIATSEYSARDINEDILIRFYYLNNKDSLNADKNYLVDLEKCNLYLSDYFHIVDFDLKKSIYYDRIKDVLDLTSCMDLDETKTEIVLEKYTQTQEKVEVQYRLNFLVGDDLPPAKKSLLFLYDGEKYIFEQVKQQ
ncbi:MAG: hypothetical protein RR253_00520 [Oscillospiraceae bacterium]